MIGVSDCSEPMNRCKRTVRIHDAERDRSVQQILLYVSSFFLIDLTIHLSKMRHYNSRFQQSKVNPTFIYDYEDQTSICSYSTGT